MSRFGFAVLTVFLFQLIVQLDAQQQQKLKDLSSVSLAFNQDETPSSSKHRHAVEHLEPDPAKTIFNAAPGRNPLMRTTAVPRLNANNNANKKHSGAVINGRRGLKWFFGF